MSFDIYIGNKIKKSGKFIVEEIELRDAPFFDGDGFTGFTNGRHPGYSAMYHFSKNTGLYGLFYSKKNGLLVEHPGHVELKESHRRKISAARRLKEKERPNIEPGWSHGQDPDYARLIWFEWWIKWALKNCEYPAIYNK